eukprot:2264144-Pyramimonas_sp.AAC.1
MLQQRYLSHVSASLPICRGEARGGRLASCAALPRRTPALALYNMITSCADACQSAAACTLLRGAAGGGRHDALAWAEPSSHR